MRIRVARLSYMTAQVKCGASLPRVHLAPHTFALPSVPFQRSSIPSTASVYALNINALRAFKLLKAIFELRTAAAGDTRRLGYTVRLHGHRLTDEDAAMTFRSSPTTLTSAAAMFAALMCMPTAASAWDDHDNNNTTRTKQVNQDVVWNDASVCTGDYVEGTGREVITVETTTSSNGKTMRFRSTHSLNGTGVGAPSGARYQLQDLAKDETITTARTFTETRDERKHLIRTSWGYLPSNKHDDEFLHQYSRMTVKDGEPTFSVDKTTVECKGSSSKEYCHD